MPYKDPKDPRKNVKHKARRIKWRKKNLAWAQEYARRNILKYRFGITLEQKVQMWEAQDRKCANPHCAAPLRDPRIAKKAKDSACVDHSHSCCSGVKTCGKCLRALLCPSCNTVLGLMEDDRYKIEGLIIYLSKFAGTLFY